VAAKIGPKTKAIIAVHLFGQCADMDPILAAAKKRNIPVIEDAAQALGAKDKGRMAGTMGTLGCFSFFPTKNLGTLGEGGLVTAKDPDLAEKIRKLRVHGAKIKYFHEMIGGNFRLHELQAAFLRVKLRHLDQALKNRRENAVRLIRELQDKWKAVFPVEQCLCEGERQGPKNYPEGTVLLPFSCQKNEGDHTWNQFVIRVLGEGQRDNLRLRLSTTGVQTEIYYPKSLHQQQCFQENSGECKDAEQMVYEVLAIPLALEF
jgi:dTDP-4-amino-4,6-dideoxygalactose transaminase